MRSAVVSDRRSDATATGGKSMEIRGISRQAIGPDRAHRVPAYEPQARLSPWFAEQLSAGLGDPYASATVTTIGAAAVQWSEANHGDEPASR